MSCVGTSVQEVTRCPKSEELFRRRDCEKKVDLGEGRVTGLLTPSCFCSSLQLRSEDPASQRQGALQLCQFSERPGP